VARKEEITMNKYPCDRCGKPTHDESGEVWLDGAGNCEACGDDLCPECAGDWVAGGPYCERCSIQFMLDDAVQLGNSDEHFYLAKEVIRLRKIINTDGAIEHRDLLLRELKLIQQSWDLGYSTYRRDEINAAVAKVEGEME